MKIVENKHTIVCLKPVNNIGIDRLKIHSSNWVKTDYCVDWVENHVDLSKYQFFWFEDRISTKIYGEGILTIKTKTQWQSGKYFINAYVEDYSDVVLNNQELAKRMTNLGWTHVVKNVGLESCWVERFDPKHDQLIQFVDDGVCDE